MMEAEVGQPIKSGCDAKQLPDAMFTVFSQKVDSDAKKILTKTMVSAFVADRACSIFVRGVPEHPPHDGVKLWFS